MLKTVCLSGGIAILCIGAILVGCQRLDTVANTSTPTDPNSNDNTNTFNPTGGYFPPGSNDGDENQKPEPAGTEEELGEETASHFRAYQIDTFYEDTAGPKFIRHADINRDGLEDLVTGWNQSQPVHVHLRIPTTDDTVKYKSINVGATYPLGVLGGLDVADLNGDDWVDIAIAVKHNGTQAYDGSWTALTTWCGTNGFTTDPQPIGANVGQVIILFNPGDADQVEDGEQWPLIGIDESLLDGLLDVDEEMQKRAPEWNGYTDLRCGDVSCDGLADIVVCFNPAVAKKECEEFPVNRVVAYENPGPEANTNTWSTAWGAVNQRFINAYTGPIVKSLALNDVDLDGELDIIWTRPNQESGNIFWALNECIPWSRVDNNGATNTWDGEWPNVYPIGHVDPWADVITMDDIDGDGYDDVLVRSITGKVAQWFKRPTEEDIEPIFPPYSAPTPDRVPPSDANATHNFTWPVFTIHEFEIRQPEGIALGDVTGDGYVEAIVAAGGAVFWFEFDAESEGQHFDKWRQNFVVDDSKDEGQTVDPNDPDFTDEGTYINNIIVLDVDGDGANDLLATFDRRTMSGISDDSIIWFRNTILDPEEE